MARPLTQRTRSGRRSAGDANKEASASLESAKQRLEEARERLGRMRESPNVIELVAGSIKILVRVFTDRLGRLSRRDPAGAPDPGGEHRQVSRTVVVSDRAVQEADGALQRVHEDLTRASDAADDLGRHAMQRDRDIQLVGSIMSAQVQPDVGVEATFGEFKALVSDYLKESRVDNFPAEADAYADLNVIQSKLSRIRLAPRISRKNVVAVAGGFNSGKSSFINSLIGTEPGVLPTRITPTTSIPTYVHHVPGGELDIALFNEEGGRSTIDADVLGAITHEFERDYGIPLRRIVSRLVISTPYLERLARIVFVDTPGHTNPGGDKEVALTEILSAHYLVWVVDCDKGALPEGDLDYIKDFQRSKGSKNMRGPSVYIVLNKADKKCSDRQTILAEVADTADRHELQCAGVGLYSAHETRWYDHRGVPFQAFLDEINEIKPNLTIKDDVSAVLDRYVEYHQTQENRFDQQTGLLNRLGSLPLVDDQRTQGRRISKDPEQAWKSAKQETDRHKKHAAAYLSLRRRFDDCMGRFTKALEGTEKIR